MGLPDIKTFTTDPTKKVDDFADVLENKVSSTQDFLEDGVNDAINSLTDNALFDTLEDWGLDIGEFKLDRCGNVPEFDVRFDLNIPDLGLGLNDLPCGLDEKINELLDDYEDEEYWEDKVKDEDGNDVDIAPSADPMEVKVNQETTQAFTGSDDVPLVADAAMDTATAGGLMRQATRMGLHENIKILMEQSPPSVNMSKLFMYLLASLRRAIDQALLKVINAAVNITGGEALVAVYPDCIESILRGYKLPSGATEANYASNAQYLIDTLDKINPFWDRYRSLPYYEAGQTIPAGYKCDVPTIKPYLTASDDAVTVLAFNDRTKVQIALIPTFRQMRIQSAVKLYYPYAAVE